VSGSRFDGDQESIRSLSVGGGSVISSSSTPSVGGDGGGGGGGTGGGTCGGTGGGTGGTGGNEGATTVGIDGAGSVKGGTGWYLMVLGQ